MNQSEKEIKLQYLEERCRKLWEENEDLKFKLFLKGIKIENEYRKS